MLLLYNLPESAVVKTAIDSKPLARKLTLSLTFVNVYRFMFKNEQNKRKQIIRAHAVQLGGCPRDRPSTGAA